MENTHFMLQYNNIPKFKNCKNEHFTGLNNIGFCNELIEHIKKTCSSLIIVAIWKIKYKPTI